MSSTDDIQIDMAGCLLGVFAVLWITKDSVSPEEYVDVHEVEISIGAIEKIFFASNDTNPDLFSERIHSWRVGDFAVPLPGANEKRRDVLERLSFVVPNGSTNGVINVSSEIVSVPISPGYTSPQDGLGPTPIPFVFRPVESLSKRFRISFDSSALRDDSLQLVLCFDICGSKPPLDEVTVTYTTTTGPLHTMLYSLSPRWEVRTAGQIVDGRLGASEGSYAYHKASSSKLAWRHVPSNCVERVVPIESDQISFVLRLTDQVSPTAPNCSILASAP